jgi:type VI secretion system secreted protein VgrG
MTVRLLRFEIAIEGLDGMPMRVESFELHEGLSSPPRGRLSVEVEGTVVANDVIGKKVDLTVAAGLGRTERTFHTLVVEATSQNRLFDRSFLELVIASKLDRASFGQDCRLFVDKTVPEVVQEVLEKAGIPSDSMEQRLSASYPMHAMIRQHNESDLAFVERLLLEEGIGYVVRNDLDDDKILFFDDDGVVQPLENEAELPFRRSTTVRTDLVLDLADRRTARSDAVMLRDYDFLHPSLDLSSKSEAESATGREIYHHPGGFLVAGDGNRRAKAMLERTRLRSHVVEGRSDAMDLEPVRSFTLTGHPRTELDQEYVVLEVTHRATDDDGGGISYENSVVAVARDTPLRPERAEAEPRIGGVEVAFVTGPSGEELHGSENGQVKVRFPWDRNGPKDDKSSNWLRVGQLAMPGSMIVPRVGFEVLVDFELGDLDRPLVVGHLYNGEATVPYGLPAAATKSSLQTGTTPGGGSSNELRFEDSAGGEEMFLNASYDYVSSAENDSKTTVNANEDVKIGSNSKVTIGSTCTTNVTGARSTTISGSQTVGVDADMSAGVGGAHSITVGSRKETCGGDLSEATTGSLKRSVGGAASFTGIAAYNRNIVGSSKTKVGGALAIMSAKSLLSSCGGARLETIGALKFVKAKTVAVACGAAYARECAVEQVKAGGNRIDSSGGAIAITSASISIKAADVNISGKSKVVFQIGGGTTITVKPGSVEIKSGKVELKGAKRMKSGQHKST